MDPEYDPSRLSRDLKAEAVRLGFDACGISAADRLEPEADRLRAWLHGGMHGTMGWMANHFDKRTDPRVLVPGARSVVSVLQNYFHPVELCGDPGTGRISRYALGDDYHMVMKERLTLLLEWLDRHSGGVSGRVFVDSAPVMDKAWAARSGLGWIGKHSNLINRDLGSWFFIGEMIVDTELTPDGPTEDMCGSCTKCLDACPTGAITEEYVVDANRCISYLTIEHREDDIDGELASLMGNWIFGCDVCQDVCPWNKFRKDSHRPEYAPRPGTVGTALEDWRTMEEDVFRERFRDSPVKRSRWSGFMRNVRLASSNAARTGADDARRRKREEAGG